MNVLRGLIGKRGLVVERRKRSSLTCELRFADDQLDRTQGVPGGKGEGARLLSGATLIKVAAYSEVLERTGMVVSTEVPHDLLH